ncbi:hypothetical protein BKA62DRAFT_827312 [Auriculariales sp. MPI-PUGE-AT-0066]|nr:hypothetical protein BKA62DRAFT_827312 [Auriculariales sp. MPI-PUGE-AT-0066]
MPLQDVGALAFLTHYPFPAWVLSVETYADLRHDYGPEPVLTGLSLKPIWTNGAYAELRTSGVDWQETVHNLVQSAFAQPTDLHACSAYHSPWCLVATVTQNSKQVVITASRRGHEDVTVARRKEPSPEQEQSAPQSDKTLRKHHSRLSISLDPGIAEIWSQSETGRDILKFAWESTPLGPLSSWSSELKTIVTTGLLWPERFSMWFGPEMIGMWNDAYLKVLGPRKRVDALGRSFRDIFSEFFDTVKGYCYRALAGEVICHRKNLLIMDRERVGDDESSWGLEECYHDWSFVPIRVNGEVIGFVNQSTETTAAVIAERRIGTLRALSLVPPISVDRATYFTHALEALEANPLDMPFIIMYRVHQLPALPNHRIRYHVTLYSKIGVPEGHVLAPLSSKTRASLSASSSAASESTADAIADEEVWPFTETIVGQKIVLVQNLGSRAKGFEHRGWDHACRTAVMFPVGVTEEAPSVVVIVGLNPCRPYDDEYREFLELVGSQLSSGLTSVLNFETAKKKAEELASLDRAKTVFFGNVSHELRNPLTLILGPLEDIIAEPNQTPISAVRTNLKVMLRHARRLHQLVNSLLDFARLEAGRFIASFRPVNIGSLTADLASLFRSAIERGGVHYTVVCEEGREVFLDIDAYEKVVTNIISNAFKYCLTGAIEVRLEYTRTDAIFSCADTGCGIPESELGNIFHRFHRVENHFGRSIEGSGVGLALTYETVKSLGGKLTVHSEVNVGSTFMVSLPLGTSHIPPERLVREPPSGATKAVNFPMRYGAWLAEEANGWLASDSSGDSRSSATAESRSASERDSAPSASTSSSAAVADERENMMLDNALVVVADDNADLRHYCVNLLSSNYHVRAFVDGQDALDFVLENDCDLILSDVQMPRMGGYKFLREIRSRSSTALLPFILLSAAAGSEARTEGLDAGADDYLVKPFASKELLARVKTHLELGAMRRALESRVQERTRLLVESETRLLQQIAESEHMRKQQEIVVDLTSHELRNPLNAIWQNAELVEVALTRLRSRLGKEVSGVLDEADEAVQNILLSVAHQTRIADDILNFSKISMSLLTIHKVPFHLHETVRDVLRMWEIEVREKDIRLELTCDDELKDIWVFSDPQRILQILINLLTNAIRFTTDMTVRKITVFLRTVMHIEQPGENVFRVMDENQAFPDGLYLRIGVKDSGSGLSPEEREKLFERFSQAHPSKDQFSGGHGLGLFVCRHIISLLNGFIDVESAKGAGCTFLFSIPIERAEPQSERQQQPWKTRLLGRSPRPSPDPTRTISSAMRPRHILIVEDNIINQKVLCRQLQARGFHTSVANDGQEALDRMLDDDMAPDLVLMDIEMPVKDGKTACRELRESEARSSKPRLPAVAVTGNAREEQVQDCLDAGFDEVAIKPYRIQDLVTTIDSLLGVTNATSPTRPSEQ